MRTLQILKYITIGLTLLFSSLHADNPRQTVTKELLSSTYSGGISTLDWVVRYETNSSTPLGDVVITDNFSSAQTYVPSTEVHPNGWSVTQNPNQFIWEIGEGNGYSYSFPTPLGDIDNSGNGDGDGFIPIPYTALDGSKRFYYLNHHMEKNYPLFGCIGGCNGTWPKKLLDGDSSSLQTSGTSNGPESVIINRKLYYPVTRMNDSGIGCYDLESDTECGYIQLSSIGSVSGIISAIDGLVKNNNILLVMDANAIVYKVLVANSGLMSLLDTFDTTSLGILSGDYVNSLYTEVNPKIYNNKVFFLKSSNTPSDRKILCLESAASLSPCAGWSTAKVFSSMHIAPYNGFFYYNSGMSSPTHICTSRSNHSASLGVQKCASITTGVVSILPDVVPSTITYLTGVEITVGNTTFFPSAGKNVVYPYNWTTPTQGTPIVKAGTQLYGSAMDDNGCIWFYGHNNKLWSIDSETGSAPCGEKTLVIEDTYDASDNWCATKDAEWHYTQFQINGLRPDMFTDLNVTFYDANGNVIKTANLPTNSVSFSQGLFTGPFIAGEPIHYKITGTRNPNANPNTPPPVITIGVDGPPREFCFKTTVPCPITGDITNHVEVKLQGEHTIDSSVDVVEDAQGLCKEPEPKQCLNAEPTLKCSKTGWTIELDTFTPSNYNASNTDMNVLSPIGATVTKWGDTWHVNGVSPGDTLSLSMQGVQQGAGKLEGDDLCCDGESNITISASQSCPVQMPEINVMKTYDDGIFKLHTGVLGEIHAPQVFTIADNVPDGISITGVDSRSPDWNCGNVFPVVGPAVLNCVYTGTMPVVTGPYDLYLTSTVNSSKLPIVNCMDTGIIQTDGTTVYTDPMMHHCVTIETDDNDTTSQESNCTAPKIVAHKTFKGCNESNTRCTFELTLTNSDMVNPYNGNVFISEQTTQPNIGVVPIPVTNITPAGLCTVMPTMTPLMCVTPMNFAPGETKTFTIEVNPYAPGGYAPGTFNTNGTENCFGAFPTSPNIATGSYTEESWKAAAIAAGFNESNPPPCMDQMSSECAGYEENNETENNNTTPPDVNETNSSCLDTQILVNGVCEDLPEDPCPPGQQMVDNQCIEMPEINCHSNIILVVDKSNSISQAGGTTGVKNMMQSFLDRFRGNGSQAAIVYFDTTASIVRPMSTINVGDMPPGYSPTSGGLTNWEDGLEKAKSIVSSGDIVFFITDGQPNRYLDNSNNVVPIGAPPANNTPALATLENLATLEASVVANQIKAMGARIISVGVGSIASSASAIQHLNDIASTPSDININAFSDLEGMASEYGNNACPALVLTKHFLSGTMQSNGCKRDFFAEGTAPVNTVELKIQNTTTAPLSTIVVRDVLPSGIGNPTGFIVSGGTATVSGGTITWNVGTLGANAIETLRFSISATGFSSLDYGECSEPIHNYTEVTAATGIDVTPLLVDAQNGPINLNELDEATACWLPCKANQPVESTPCNPDTDATHCLHVYKYKLQGEGNCLAGSPCRYNIRIYNDANTTYTPTLNITDNMTPNTASAITITPQGSAPNPLCSPNPTSIPFTCVQTQDVPPKTSWTYEVIMNSTPQSAVKNCFKVNGVEQCFNFPGGNKQAQEEDNTTGCKTDKDCEKREYCSEEDGLCLPREDSPVLDVEIPVIHIDKPKPVTKPHLTLTKRAPKECKAGERCTFTLKITNRGKSTYSGPLSIKDRPREFVGSLVGTSPKAWRCKTKKKGYVCSNPKVSLKAGQSTTVKLTVRIPERAKGYLNNCAKLDVLKSGKARIMAIQTMLLAQGFNPNGIDGGMGKGTKKALKAYMEKRGLKGKKAQAKAMQELFELYPHITSKNSCVKVKIKKSKIKCKKYEKLVKDKCKLRCKKWQHWDGKHCVTCPKGTKWDKRKKVCREKNRPHVNVSVKPKGKKCPKGYVKFGRTCEKISDKEIVQKKCGFLTRLNHRTGRCEPIINISIGIGGGGGKDKPRKEHDRGPAGY